MRNGVSTPSAVMRAEQLLDSVEQWIKSFFVHDNPYLQHAATSIQEKTSLAMQPPATSEVQLQPVSSSKSQGEPIGSAIEEMVSKEISEHELASQATSEEQPIPSSKFLNGSTESVARETTSSERRPATQTTYEPLKWYIASQVYSLPSTMMTPCQQQEWSFVEMLSILLLTSQPGTVQQQLLAETLANLLATLTQQTIVRQQDLSLAEVLSILLIASQH